MIFEERDRIKNWKFWVYLAALFLIINIPPMSDPNNQDQNLLILNLADNSIVSNPVSPKTFHATFQ